MRHMANTKTHPDAALIDCLGGAKHVADLTSSKAHAVYKWRKRGIPARVKLYHPDLFMTVALPLQGAPVAQGQEV